MLFPFGILRRVVLLVFWASLLVLFFSSRCSWSGGALFKEVAGYLPGVEEEGAAIPEAAEPLLETLNNQVAEELGIPPELVKIAKAEPRIWPNTCMGVSRRGVSCEEKITPGFKVTIEAQGQTLDYRLSQQGRILRAN